MRALGHGPAKVAVLTLAVAAITSGCLRREAFPVEPVIEWKSLETFPDSASLTISFTDGDGDIGLGQGDTLAPFQPGGAWYHNLFVDYYQRVNGAWVKQAFLVPLNFRVPYLTPEGQNKALEGEISVALAWPVLDEAPGHRDTIRLDVRLADRALHMSGTVSSPEIVVTY